MWSSDSSDEENVRITEPRTYKTRIDYGCMEMTYEFNERFRLKAHKLEQLISVLGSHLERNSNRNNALSSKLMLQIALHWFGTGVQYHAVSDMHGVTKGSVCNAVHSVVAAVNNVMFDAYVKWPNNMQEVVQKFHMLKGMPLVCGCLDGTLIKMDAPHQHEEVFVDRHGNHSINCLVVCGPDRKFYYSYANWPGSTHDSRVLRNSRLFEQFESGWRPISQGVLLGDSAYPLKEWLITPLVIDANDQANIRFLNAHKSTRRVIENAIGILKEKFPCLNYLRVQPTFACDVFNCCVTLCNFIRDDVDGDEQNDLDDENISDSDDAFEGNSEDVRGRSSLERMISYFRN